MYTKIILSLSLGATCLSCSNNSTNDLAGGSESSGSDFSLYPVAESIELEPPASAEDLPRAEQEQICDRLKAEKIAEMQRDGESLVFFHPPRKWDGLASCLLTVVKSEDLDESGLGVIYRYVSNAKVRNPWYGSAWDGAGEFMKLNLRGRKVDDHWRTELRASSKFRSANGNYFTCNFRYKYPERLASRDEVGYIGVQFGLRGDTGGYDCYFGPNAFGKESESMYYRGGLSSISFLGTPDTNAEDMSAKLSIEPTIQVKLEEGPDMIVPIPASESNPSTKSLLRVVD